MVRKLERAHRQFIAAEIARHIVVAADERHSMRLISRFFIDSLLWRWTADGLDMNNDVKRDLLKYDCDHQWHTIAARSRWEENGRKGDGLRHEHVVPKRELIDLMVGSRLTQHEVFDLLGRMCFAVVVTKEEDGLLSKKGRDRMPTPLTADSPCEKLFARYDAVGLKEALRSPIIR